MLLAAVPPPAAAQAVDLSGLPPHPRFFLRETLLPQLRAEVAPGSPKAAMYQEIKSRADGYLAGSPSSSNVYAVLNLVLVGKIEQNSAYTTKAAQYFIWAIDRGEWITSHIEWTIAYDWVYEYLTPTQRNATRQLALPRYTLGNQRTVYYNLEANEASRVGLAGLAFYGEGSSAENQRCQAMVDEWDGRMRGVREYAWPNGSAASKGGVLPTRQLYFPDGGYYKGNEYTQVDMEAITFYLHLFDELGLGEYWSLCASYIDNWPQYMLHIRRPDGFSQRLMSGTNFTVYVRGYESLAILASARGNRYAQWLVANGPWNGSYGGYEWALLCTLWRPDLPASQPSTLPLAKFYGASGEDQPPGSSWSEKVILRSGWNLNGDNDDVYFTLHAGDFFGDYWNFYQLAFEIYYRGALAIRSGYYLAGEEHLRNYNSRAIAANTVVVLDEQQATMSDRWGQDYLYDEPGPPMHIRDVADDNVYDTADIVFFEERTLDDGAKSYYVKGILNPGSAYHSTNATRRIQRQVREVAMLGRYFVVRDKVVQNNDDNSARWLLHTINRPTMEGVQPLSVTVPDRIITYPRARYYALRTERVEPPGSPAVQYGGKIWCAPVLPANATLRLVGGSGYEFWVDDGNGNGQNIPPQSMPQGAFTDIHEVGQWRVETVAPRASTVDFVHALWACTPAGTMAEVRAIDEPNAVGCEIDGEGVFVFGRNPDGEPQMEYRISGELLPLPQMIHGLIPEADYVIRIGESEGRIERASDKGSLCFDAIGPCRVEIAMAGLAVGSAAVR